MFSSGDKIWIKCWRGDVLTVRKSHCTMYCKHCSTVQEVVSTTAKSCYLVCYLCISVCVCVCHPSVCAPTVCVCVTCHSAARSLTLVLRVKVVPVSLTAAIDEAGAALICHVVEKLWERCPAGSDLHRLTTNNWGNKEGRNKQTNRYFINLLYLLMQGRKTKLHL